MDSITIHIQQDDFSFQPMEIPLGVDQRGWDGTWNGQPLSADVYVYYALIRFIDGEEILYKGDVTLIR